MSRFGEFMENVYKINENSAKYASNFQQVNEEVSSKVYNVGIGSIKPLLDFISKFKYKMIDIFPFTYSANLIPLLTPTFDALSSKLGNEITSNLESFRLSIFWRFKPLTEIIDKIVDGIREESQRIILHRRRLTAYSVQPKIYQITSEEEQIISESIGQMPKYARQLYSKTPKITIRHGDDYSDHETKDGKLISEVETQDKQLIKFPLEFPIVSLIPNLIRIRRNAVSVLEKSMATKFSSSALTELYTQRFSDSSRFSIPVIKRGLQLLSVSGLSSYKRELPSAKSSFIHIEDWLREGLIVAHPSQTSSKLDYDPLHLPAHVFMVKSSLSESVFSNRLLEIETLIKEILEHFFRLYPSSPLISTLQSITGISKIDRDHFIGKFTRSTPGYPETSIAALAAIAPRASKVNFEMVKHLLLPLQLMDLDKSKYVFSLSEMGSYSKMMTEKAVKSTMFRTQLYPVLKILNGVFAGLDDHTVAARGVYPSTSFKRAKNLQVEKYFGMDKRFDVFSETGRAISLMRDGFKQLPFRASTLLLQSSIVKMADAISDHQPIKLNLNVLDTFYGISKEIHDQETGVQKTLQLSVDEAISDMIVIEKNALESFPLDTTMTVPTLKLQEIISAISSIQSPAEREMPARVTRNRLTKSGLSRSIEVTADSLRDERDIRELERKITRLLREEARRHGLI